MSQVLLMIDVTGDRHYASLVEQYLLSLHVTIAKSEGHVIPRKTVSVEDGDSVVTYSETPLLKIKVCQLFTLEGKSPVE